MCKYVTMKPIENSHWSQTWSSSSRFRVLLSIGGWKVKGNERKRRQSSLQPRHSLKNCNHIKNCVRVCVCVYTQTCTTAHMWIQEDNLRTWFILPCGFQRSTGIYWKSSVLALWAFTHWAVSLASHLLLMTSSSPNGGEWDAFFQSSKVC
jgi:hypothetical protein